MEYMHAPTQTLADVKYLIDKGDIESLKTLQQHQQKYLQQEDRTHTKIKRSLKKDDFALLLLPSDMPKLATSLFPAKTTGNGDCLFNAASIIFKGDETLSGILRASTAVELFLNAELYAKHSHFDKAVSHPQSSLTADSFRCIALTDKANQCYTESGDLRKAIEIEAKETCTPGNWSSFVHLMALSGLLRRNVWSIYPESNKGIRPLFHSQITHPLVDNTDDIYIMWTRDGNFDNRKGYMFEPNHFVPLIPMDLDVNTDFSDSGDELVLSLDAIGISKSIDKETRHAKQTEQEAEPTTKNEEEQGMSTEVKTAQGISTEEKVEQGQLSVETVDQSISREEETKGMSTEVKTAQGLSTEDNVELGKLSEETVKQGISREEETKGKSTKVKTAQGISTEEKLQQGKSSVEAVEQGISREEETTGMSTEVKTAQGKSTKMKVHVQQGKFTEEYVEQCISTEEETYGELDKLNTNRKNPKTHDEKEICMSKSIDNETNHIKDQQTKQDKSTKDEEDKDKSTELNTEQDISTDKKVEQGQSSIEAVEQGTSREEETKGVHENSSKNWQDVTIEFKVNPEQYEEGTKQEAFNGKSETLNYRTLIGRRKIKRKCVACNTCRDTSKRIKKKYLEMTKHKMSHSDSEFYTTGDDLPLSEVRKSVCKKRTKRTRLKIRTNYAKCKTLDSTIVQGMQNHEVDSSVDKAFFTNEMNHPAKECQTTSQNGHVSSQNDDATSTSPNSKLSTKKTIARKDLGKKHQKVNNDKDKNLNQLQQKSDSKRYMIDSTANSNISIANKDEQKVIPKKRRRCTSQGIKDKEKKNVPCMQTKLTTLELRVERIDTQTINKENGIDESQKHDDCNTTRQTDAATATFITNTQSEIKKNNAQGEDLMDKTTKKKQHNTSTGKRKLKFGDEKGLENKKRRAVHEEKEVNIEQKLEYDTSVLDDSESTMEESESEGMSDIDIDMFMVSDDSTSTKSSSDDEPLKGQGDSLTWLSRLQKIKPKSFIGPTPGPTKQLAKDSTPLDYFYQIFPESIVELMCSSTNAYVPIYQAARQAKDPTWTDTFFKQVTTDVLKAYLGMRMIMSVDPKASIEDYWSKEQSLRNIRLSNIMSRERFKSIQRYFHINDPVKDPARRNDDVGNELKKKDPLYKASPLMEQVRKNSNKLYNLHQQLSVDEAMIKCHGQHWSIVGAPNKPAKRGFKVFVLADAVSGYMSDFMVYIRRKKEIGLTQRVVETLTEPVYDRNHIIFVDKFYTSVPLAISLFNRGTYICGSFNTGRHNWPADLKESKTKKRKDDKVRNLKRGEHMTRQTKDGTMVATVWKDKKHVYNLNNYYDPTANARNDKVERRQQNEEGKWQKLELPCPKPIVEFNKYMGGVDRHDHLRSSYSLQRASTRWWTYFCWFAIDLALINSYLLYKHTHPKATHKKFQLKVAEELIGGYTERKRIVRQNDCSPLQAESLNSHESVKMPGRPRVCRYCLKFKVKTPGGRTKESSHGCAQCNVSLHRDCFAAYHYDMQRKTPMVDESTQTGDILLTPSKTRSSTQSLQGNLGSSKARSSTQPVQGKLGSNKARSSTQPLQGKGSGKSKLLRTRPNNTSANKSRRQTQNQKAAGRKPPPKRRSPRKKTR